MRTALAKMQLKDSVKLMNELVQKLESIEPTEFAVNGECHLHRELAMLAKRLDGIIDLVERLALKTEPFPDNEEVCF